MGESISKEILNRNIKKNGSTIIRHFYERMTCLMPERPEKVKKGFG